MFLRCNRYDAKASAHQLIRFFDTKLQLFGKDKLVQDITLNDLDDDDRACVQNGSRQILPCTDSAKRPIIVDLPGLRSFKCLDNELRARFYIFMSILESQEAQIRGIVMLIYTVGRHRDSSNGIGYVENAKLGLAVPIHYAGLHFCSDDLRQYILLRLAIAVVPAKVRARFKVHLGSHLECQYLVSSYGISREVLISSSMDDEARLDNNFRWYKERYIREIGVDLPQNLMNMPNLPRPQFDVLFGRKKNHHSGNKSLYLLVKRHSEAYDTASRSRKRELTGELVREIQATGGRFLKQVGDSECWEEVSTEEAQEKVAQGFRNIRRPRAEKTKIEPPQIGAVGELFSDHGPNDVLFGRVRNNVGNMRVRQLVGDLSKEYDSASKVRKRQLAESVVQEIKRKGARFLKQREDDRWEEVSDDFARTKISKHFSNNRRCSQKKANTGQCIEDMGQI
jgi:hypothetical protein